jgi:ABC-type multidrug transport system permease subunit
VIIPSFLFSGIIVSVDLLPVWAQVISRVSPMYYANRIVQEVVAGQTLRANVGAAAALPLYGLVVLGAATLTLREHS